MTVSIETTRLSSVITGCGGKETTCSRMSITYRTRSTNGVTTLRPGCSVARYLPNRSTIPARAWGTILTVLASTRIAKSTSTMKNANRNGIWLPLVRESCGSGPQLVGAQDVRRRTLDRHDVDRRTGLDLVVLVVRLGRPDLAADLHPARRHVRQRLQDVPALADQCLRAGPQRRPGVQ